MNGLVSGGYVGVDVFFVISGFLITSLVKREIDEERFSLHNFWVRRVRRILPASVACILGTLALSSFVMLPSDFEDVARSGVASSLAFANVFFWMEGKGGYFSGPSDEYPLLHFWSLAVEVQFYLFYPVLLLGLAKLRRISVVQFLVGAAVISFSLNVWGVMNRPSATFYLLPTRAWELLAGGLLAVLPGPKFSRTYRELIALGGFIMIVGSAIMYTPQTPFPGVAALLPCLGAVCFIYANSGPQSTEIGRILSAKPVVFIGMISYSLYLWHWPILGLMRYSLIEFDRPNLGYASALIFVISAISWRWVEQPFHNRKQTKKRKPGHGLNRRPLILGFASILFTVLLSGAIVAGDGWFWRFNTKEQPLLEDATWAGLDMQTRAESNNYPRIGDKSAQDLFVVWGDSHAMMMVDVLDIEAKNAGIGGRFISLPGVAPLPRVWRHLGASPPHPEAEEVVHFIQENRIPNVILIARWSAYVEGYSESDLRFEERGKSFDQLLIGDERTEAFCPSDAKRVLRKQLSKLINIFGDAGIKVWLVQQVPEQHGPTAFPFLLQEHLGLSVEYFPTNIEAHNSRQADTNFILQSMTQMGASVIETQHLFFDQNSKPILFRNGRACFRDNDHLTKFGAQELLSDALAQLMHHILGVPNEGP